MYWPIQGKIKWNRATTIEWNWIYLKSKNGVEAFIVMHCYKSDQHTPTHKQVHSFCFVFFSTIEKECHNQRIGGILDNNNGRHVSFVQRVSFSFFSISDSTMFLSLTPLVHRIRINSTQRLNGMHTYWCERFLFYMCTYAKREHMWQERQHDISSTVMRTIFKTRQLHTIWRLTLYAENLQM